MITNNFTLQHLYIGNQRDDENKEVINWGNIELVNYPILRTNFTRNVSRSVRRINIFRLLTKRLKCYLSAEDKALPHFHRKQLKDETRAKKLVIQLKKARGTEATILVTRLGKIHFITQFASPHPCEMLTTHSYQTQVCISPFSNIERGKMFFAHFPTQLVYGCSLISVA